MSQTYELLEQGFERGWEENGTFLIFNGKEKRCIASGIENRLEQKEAGWQRTVPRPTCTMLHREFAELGIKQNEQLEIVTTPRGVTPRETIKLTLRAPRAASQSPLVKLYLAFQT